MYATLLGGMIIQGVEFYDQAPKISWFSRLGNVYDGQNLSDSLKK